jgi:dTMP kinase
MTERNPGILVAFEGVDGSGKSTQAYLLHKHLEAQGCRVFFSAWNSSAIVKGATRRGKKQNLLTPTTFSLVHATDFADRYERQILPMLKSGYIVLCDRYIYTAYARDRVRGCDPDWLQRLYAFARRPDITLYFDLPLETALARILEGRPRLKYHEAGMDLGLAPDIVESFRIFQGRVMQEYLAMAGGEAFSKIDATQEIHDMQRTVRDLIHARVDLARYQRRVRIMQGVRT